MNERHNPTAAPKTATFQMRIKPEVKGRLEKIYADCGLALTDAVNIFFQQSMNVEGLPFLVTRDNKALLHRQAVALLMAELQKGEESVCTEEEWISEEEILAKFGEVE